ncbi:MAG: SDR family oxidoreductase [Hyphomicrobiaceae bacterium]|nr:SDR family oxidoreductase [Hyphomicrobiaceae bacterium]
MRRVAIITGASRGIGRATALLAAREGYDVCINYKEDAAAAETVAGECKSLGVRSTAYRADVARRDDVCALFSHCDEVLGRVTLLVNNAGIIGQASRLEDLTEAALDETFAVNLFGSVYCAQHAIARMSASKGGPGGVIINLSSIAAATGSPNEYVHYAASKAAIEALTIGLSKEVGPDNIRVNAVRAGTTDTEIHARSGNPGRPAMVAQTAPLRRVATPEDIAQAVMWLASDQAGFASGAILSISGGL